MLPSLAHLDISTANFSNSKKPILKQPEMSEQYTSFALPPVAERVRKRIKDMLPGTGTEGSSEEKPERAQKLPIKIEGGVMHGGNVLLKRVSELVKEMGAANIGKVTGAVIRLIA